MMQSQTQRVKAERLMRLPGFTLGYHHSWEDGDVFNGLIVGVTLPVFSTHNKVRAAKALRRSLEYDEMTVAIQRRATVKSDREKALALYRQMTAYESALKNDNSVELLKRHLKADRYHCLTISGRWTITCRLSVIILTYNTVTIRHSPILTNTKHWISKCYKHLKR